jgi:hypothetical protein
MGATGWTHFVLYQEDAEKALQELRNDVFARREYTLPSDMLVGLNDEAIARTFPPLAQLRKLLNISKALDKVMKDLGADTEAAEKDTKGVERFIRDAEQEGIAKAVRKMPGARKKRPKSIKRAREIASGSGTHSILDIDRTSPVRGFGLASPLSPEELLALFGTERPTPEAVLEKEKQDALFGLRDRWEAGYFTVFEGDKPSATFFFGHSGD